MPKKQTKPNNYVAILSNKLRTLHIRSPGYGYEKET